MPTVVASGQNAFISFTDGQGSAQLTTATGRFDGWQPNAEDVGASDVALGTGLTYKFIYRTDYTASFSISAIPATSMPVALRLKRWLEAGGQITVATQDLVESTYACVIAPKSGVKFTYDRTLLEYTLTMSVLNTAAGPMVCIYSSTLGTGFTITSTPAQVTLGPTVGQSVTLVIGVTDASGNPVTNFSATFLSSNPQIATVTAAGLVTAEATGSCSITVTVGGDSLLVPVGVQLSQAPSTISLSPSSLAFTATSYTTLNPTAGKSGVPSQTITATVLNSSGQALPINPGMLVWTAGAGVTISDNGAGVLTVTAVAGSQSGTITCKLASNNTVVATAMCTTVASVPAVLVPNTTSFNLTVVGQTQTLAVQATLSQYGEVIP